MRALQAYTGSSSFNKWMGLTDLAHCVFTHKLLIFDVAYCLTTCKLMTAKYCIISCWISQSLERTEAMLHSVYGSAGGMKYIRLGKVVVT